MKFTILYQRHQKCEVIIDDEDFEKISKHNWFAVSMNKNTERLYPATTIKKKTTILHSLIIETPKGYCIRHKNGNNLDNRKQNLILCTRSELQQASKRHKNGKSRFRGVYRCIVETKYKDDFYVNKYWVASITVRRKLINLGSFDSEKLAAKAYNEAAKSYFGENAVLNEI